jgi:DNA helicase-2/ATP-dependent DNA helicase PcrA
VNEIRLGPGDWDLAVADSDGPQIVVAGPGTGKTEFLIERVCHLIESGRAHRDQIALLTFSRRAAGDVRHRVEAALDRRGMPIAASTFHSLALRLLEAGPESERSR